MKAIQFTQYGDYDQLKLVEAPMLILEKGQLLVRVAMTTVNRY